MISIFTSKYFIPDYQHKQITFSQTFRTNLTQVEEKFFVKPVSHILPKSEEDVRKPLTLGGGALSRRTFFFSKDKAIFRNPNNHERRIELKKKLRKPRHLQ